MNNATNQISNRIAFFIMLIMLAFTGKLNAQLVTNGGFEDSPTGIVSDTQIDGWLIQVGSGLSAAPVFEIIDSPAQSGNRALKVTVNSVGTNQWDIQVVADSIPVTPGSTYNYSIWARAEKAGAQVNFTMGNYSYSEYKVIRPANLTTSWTEYKMQFTVNDDQTYIRGPIHFSYSGNLANNIYLDNMQIVDVNAPKKPTIVEAELGNRGSHFPILNDGGDSYVSVTSNYTQPNSPGDTSRVISYQVTFPDSGNYNLFARIRVGANAYDDDSFFYGNGFGDKDDTSSADWNVVNGLANAGFSAPSAYVNETGSLGTAIWKWVNITKNGYSGPAGFTFSVSTDSLTKTFQIGGRENGLDIDKFAFGKSYLYFTVENLDSVQVGSISMEPEDSSNIWKGPALAEGQAKFLGNVPGDTPEKIFAKYWTQLTPGNAGKWASVAGASSDTTKWNWNNLTAQYNYALANNLIFKNHCLIWGAQQPSWISSLDSTQQISYIETWIRMVGQRFPEMDMIDVVNEPLVGHNPPDGVAGRANYKKALGGNGTTGWDWVIKSFELARQYLPNTKLLLNDYGIINDNISTNIYLSIINLLKNRGLIDGIGVQGHRFELESADTNILKNNLNRLAGTGLPIYISELDLGNIGDSGTPNDAQQLQLYQKIFPILWKHPGVKGITLWGYLEGQMWQPTCFLVNADGTSRPALTWLAQYVKDNPTDVEETLSELPSNFQLEQNYPNPFNPTTNIKYNIPKQSHVVLRVYDVLGRVVKTLVNDVQSPGQYTVTFSANNLASGIYFYRLESGDFASTKKLIFMK